MKSILTYSIIGILFILSNCRNDEVAKNANSTNENGNTNPAKSMQDSHIITNETQADEQRPRSENTPSPLNGNIVPTVRKVSPGREYLELLAQGRANPPTILNAENVKNINIEVILDNGEHVSQGLADLAITDSIQAYARYMDRPIPVGMLADVRCLGLYETQKHFILFFGFESETLENFLHSYTIIKSNGQINRYRR